MRSDRNLRLVAVPSDPIEAYEKGGIDWLEHYYNPQKFFREVYVLSPLERGERVAHGMTIRGVAERRFRDALLEIQPDVVRAYGGYWPSDLVCRNRIPNVPVVVSVHDRRPDWTHRSVRYADLVLCLSRAVEVEVLARGVDASRIRRLPNRVDTSVFRPISDATELDKVRTRFPSGKHILHVGRKSPEKNLDTLIGALKFLPANYSAVFVGPGETFPYVTLAKKQGVASRCFWVESVPNSELPLWYSWCDCMCTPSRCEGFGIVFIEAAACGTPVITSNMAPMTERFAHGINAELVSEFENPETLARTIQKVCEDETYRRRLSVGAIEAARPLSSEYIDAVEVAIYEEALGLEPRVRTADEWSWSAANRLHGSVSRIARAPGRLFRRLCRTVRKSSGTHLLDGSV